MKVTEKADLPIIFKVQKDSFMSEAIKYNDMLMLPMTETIEQVEEAFDTGTIFFKHVEEDNIVGSVRAKLENEICMIGRLFVKPGYQNRGIGKTLLLELESYFKNESKVFKLSTGEKSDYALKIYYKFGYKICGQQNINDYTIYHMEKENKQ